LHATASIDSQGPFMRELIKEFVRICAEILPVSEPIYEFGSFQVPGQKGFADLRPIFPGKKYVGADLRGVGVDVVLNLHEIDLPSESVGTVLILDTLERVEYLLDPGFQGFFFTDSSPARINSPAS